jgi:hypothetical protein
VRNVNIYPQRVGEWTGTPVTRRLNWDEQVSFWSILVYQKREEFYQLLGHKFNYNKGAKGEAILATEFH